MFNLCICKETSFCQFLFLKMWMCISFFDYNKIVLFFIRVCGQQKPLSFGVSWAKPSWTKTGKKQQKQRKQWRKDKGSSKEKESQKGKLGFLNTLECLIAKKRVGTVHQFKSQSQTPLSSPCNVLIIYVWFMCANYICMVYVFE